MIKIVIGHNPHEKFQIIDSATGVDLTGALQVMKFEICLEGADRTTVAKLTVPIETLEVLSEHVQVEVLNASLLEERSDGDALN